MSINNINWKNINKYSFLIIFQVLLGIASSLIAYSFVNKTTNLKVILAQPSYRGSQAVIDVIIRNDGDYNLKGVSAFIEFAKEPKVSITPKTYEKYILINGVNFSLIAPADLEFNKNDSIELRFVSDGFNEIKDKNNLSIHIYAQHIISQKVYASLRGDSWFPSVFQTFESIILLAIFILVFINCIILLCLFIYPNLFQSLILFGKRDQK